VATEWFCEISDEQLGPLSSQQLKTMADEGRLTGEDRVRQGTDGAWVPAGRVKGLFPADGSPGRTFDSGDIPVARPIETQPAARPAAKAVDLPVAQPASSSRQVPARAKRAATPPPAPAPRRQAASRVAAAPAGQLGIVTEANPRLAKITGHGSGNVEDRRHKKQRQHVTLVVCLMLLLLGLVGTGAWVFIAKPRFGGSGDTDEPATARNENGEDSPASPADNSASGKPAEDGLWTDASSKSVKCGSVTVKVLSVETGIPSFLPTARGVKRGKEHVMIRVELKNTSQDRKIVEYKGFGRSSAIRLSDDVGNPYDRVPTGSVEGQLQKESLHPDEPVEDLLVFQRLVSGVNFLKLELPASVLDEKENLRFKIPKSMIGKADPPSRLEPPGDDEPDPPDETPNVPDPEKPPPGDDVDPEDPIPIPGVTGEDPPTEPNPFDEFE